MTTLDSDALIRLGIFLRTVHEAAIEHKISLSSAYVEVEGSNASGTMDVSADRLRLGLENNGYIHSLLLRRADG